MGDNAKILVPVLETAEADWELIETHVEVSNPEDSSVTKPRYSSISDVENDDSVSLHNTTNLRDPTKPRPTQTGNSDIGLGLGNRVKVSVRVRVRDCGLVIGIGLGLG